MPSLPPRQVRLVIVRPDGEPLGISPVLAVSTQWWPEMRPVVEVARQELGLRVIVLRLLEAESEHGAVGGRVTYLAEVEAAPSDTVALDPWSGMLDEHPLRQKWARPGGPQPDLALADGVLRGLELVPTGPAEQVRSWNLSSLWRIPVEGQVVWLKHVPPFFGHEGAILARLAGGPVPTLLGHDRGRILMEEIPGVDLYGAEPAVLEELVRVLVALQVEWTGRTDELLRLGLPDWRDAALSPAIADVVERTATELLPEERATLSEFLDGLPARFARVAANGLPDTLVHGDFHPGNARGDGSSLTLLDWGDSGVGHPLLDQAAFLDQIPGSGARRIREVWHSSWRRAVPGSNPERAAALLAPIAAARQAVIYRIFLDGIEPSERAYHRSDPALWLRKTASAVRGEA